MSEPVASEQVALPSLIHDLQDVTKLPHLQESILTNAADPLVHPSDTHSDRTDILRPKSDALSTATADSGLEESCPKRHGKPGDTTRTRFPKFDYPTLTSPKRKFEDIEHTPGEQHEDSLRSYVLAPPASVAAAAEVLCIKCAQINLEKVFNSVDEIKTRRGLIVAQFGRRLGRGGTSACGLCRFFGSVRLLGKDCSEHHLRAFSFLRSSPELRSNSFRKDLRHTDNVFLLVLPGREIVGSQEEAILAECWNAGYICRTVPSPACGLDQIHAEVVTQYVHYPILREWLSFCQHNHPICGGRANEPLERLRLVDCDTLSIVPASPISLYIALSYVWSHENNAHQQRVRTDKQLHPKSENGVLPDPLPKVISDSIVVTRELGMRFLWVDKYCIDQNNVAEKHDQITKMDMIYRRAQLTIVAAAGKDENFGLPGVFGLSRTSQRAARAGNVTLVSTMGHPSSSIREAKWSSRAWTYQEAVLSRRRLVFTDRQVYFECDAMNCYESLYFPLSSFHTKNKNRYHEFVRSGIFAGRGDYISFGGFHRPYERSFVRAWTHIQNYTARSLTDESDSLNALIGVLQDMRSASPPIYHYWGLPIVNDGAAAGTRGLVRSLEWRHEDDGGVRRQAFPSWTWAGWEGKVTHARAKFSSLEAKQKNALSALISLEWKNGQVVALKDIHATDIHRMMGSFVPFLHLEASVVLPDVFLAKGSRPQRMKSGGRHCFTLEVGGQKADLYMSTCLDSPSDFISNIQTRTWECVILCGDRFIMSSLVIGWHGPLAIRVGQLVVYSASRDRLWKAIPTERRKIRLG